MSHASILTVSVLTEPETLVAIRPEWQHLHTAAGADIFLSWDWLIPWQQYLGQDRQLFVLLARDMDGRARGLLPLSLETARVGFRTVRRLRFLGDDEVGSDYLDALVEPGWSQAANQAFADTLIARDTDWDLLDLRDMDQTSTIPYTLLSAMGDRFTMHSVPGICCPGQDFDPNQSPDDFLGQTRRFKNYARRRKWLERQPGFRIDICQDSQTLEPALEHFFRLHQLRWQEDGGSSGIAGDQVEAFHREAMTRLMSAGKLRLYTMWVDEQAVASVYALTHDRTFYYYQAGMDPAWRSKSVGLVLIGETFADAIRSGFSRYDFLRGEEAYKFDWVNGSRRLASRRLFARRSSCAQAVNVDIRLSQGRALVKDWIGRAH